MFQRRKSYVDRGFQLKTAIAIISITMISFFVIVAYTGMTAAFNTKKISAAIEEYREAAVSNDHLLDSLAKDRKAPDRLVDRIKKNRNMTTAVLKKNTDIMNSFNDQNYRLISLIILVVLVQSVVIYFFLVRITHRIAGPLFVISRYMDQIKQGEVPEFRKLREKDQLQEFYTEFCEVARLFRGQK